LSLAAIHQEVRRPIPTVIRVSKIASPGTDEMKRALGNMAVSAIREVIRPPFRRKANPAKIMGTRKRIRSRAWRVRPK
jgi:hypothetical protein